MDVETRNDIMEFGRDRLLQALERAPKSIVTIQALANALELSAKEIKAMEVDELKVLIDKAYEAKQSLVFLVDYEIAAVEHIDGYFDLEREMEVGLTINKDDLYDGMSLDDFKALIQKELLANNAVHAKYTSLPKLHERSYKLYPYATISYDVLEAELDVGDNIFRAVGVLPPDEEGER